MKNFLSRTRKNYKKTYFSQLGEDIFLSHLIDWLDLTEPSYLDIGCSHPISLNNTYLLYTKGIRGTLIEPDISLNAVIKKNRPEDKLLNVGIGKKEGEQQFYILKNKTLNTFDPRTFENDMSLVDKTVRVPVITISKLFQDLDKIPNIVNLDIEGYQLQVIKDFDFDLYKPEVFCIETQDEKYNKIDEIYQIMSANGYFVCADTYINSLFVLKSAWDNRPLT